MSKKDDLKAQAAEAGIELAPNATIAEIEAALADANVAVVASSEHAPQHDGEPIGSVPASAAADTDTPVADHHHDSSVGPENTPAGAHRHGAFDEPHNHPVPEIPAGPDHVYPPPADDTDDVEAAPDASCTVERDCKVVVNGQLIELKAGEVATGELARYLLDTGAPVKSKG